MLEFLLGITRVLLHPNLKRTIGGVAVNGDELIDMVSSLKDRLTVDTNDQPPPPLARFNQEPPLNLINETI